MKKKDNRADAAELRRLAEKIAREKAAPAPENLKALSPEEIQQTLHELQVHQVELEIQNEELRRAQAELEFSQARYFNLYDMAPVGYLTVNETGLILESNLTAATMLRTTRNALVKHQIAKHILPEDMDIYYHYRKLLFESDKPQICELRMLCSDATAFWARLTATAAQNIDETRVFRVVLNNINERKRAEAFSEIGKNILHILNEPDYMQDSIQRVLSELKTQTGFDAVGIRLQDGDDFPYFAQDGFSKDFLLTENTLTEHTADGAVCRDKDGNVSLECTCGLVICGKTDPANPYFTKGGSCWTNDKAGTPFQDTRLHPWDRCLHDGFQSVALVPIRDKERIVGLIQLNDRSKGRLTLDLVEILEGIALNIGTALMRKRAEEELRESEEKFFVAFKTSPYAITITQSEDGRFIDVNDAFLTMTGFIREETINNASIGMGLWADAEDRSRVVRELSVGGKIVGQEFRFKKKNGEILIGLFTANFLHIKNNIYILSSINDITDRKRAEEALLEKMNDLQRLHKLTVGRELNMIELKKEVNELLKKMGQEEKYRIVE